MNLDTELILQLHVRCESNMDVKDDGSGYLRVEIVVGEGRI